MSLTSRLWLIGLSALAVVLLALGSIGILNLTGMLRYASVADDSTSSIAPAGSLALAWRTPANEVKAGDALLISAQSGGTGALGRVVDARRNGDALAVSLQGDSGVADEWRYDLGAAGYRVVVAIPAIGLAAKGLSSSAPFAVALVCAAGLLALIYAFRRWFFAPGEGFGWMKGLGAPADQQDFDLFLNWTGGNVGKSKSRKRA